MALTMTEIYLKVKWQEIVKIANYKFDNRRDKSSLTAISELSYLEEKMPGGDGCL